MTEIKLTEAQRDSIITAIINSQKLLEKFGKDNLNMIQLVKGVRKDLDEHTINFLIATGLAVFEEEFFDHNSRGENENFQ